MPKTLITNIEKLYKIRAVFRGDYKLISKYYLLFKNWIKSIVMVFQNYLANFT